MAGLSPGDGGGLAERPLAAEALATGLALPTRDESPSDAVVAALHQRVLKLEQELRQVTEERDSLKQRLQVILQATEQDEGLVGRSPAADTFAEIPTTEQSDITCGIRGGRESPSPSTYLDGEGDRREEEVRAFVTLQEVLRRAGVKGCRAYVAEAKRQQPDAEQQYFDFVRKGGQNWYWCRVCPQPTKVPMTSPRTVFLRHITTVTHFHNLLQATSFSAEDSVLLTLLNQELGPPKVLPALRVMLSCRKGPLPTYLTELEVASVNPGVLVFEYCKVCKADLLTMTEWRRHRLDREHLGRAFRRMGLPGLEAELQAATGKSAVPVGLGPPTYDLHLMPDLQSHWLCLPCGSAFVGAAKFHAHSQGLNHLQAAHGTYPAVDPAARAALAALAGAEEPPAGPLARLRRLAQPGPGRRGDWHEQPDWAGLDLLDRLSAGDRTAALHRCLSEHMQLRFRVRWAEPCGTEDAARLFADIARSCPCGFLTVAIHAAEEAVVTFETPTQRRQFPQKYGPSLVMPADTALAGPVALDLRFLLPGPVWLGRVHSITVEEVACPPCGPGLPMPSSSGSCNSASGSSLQAALLPLPLSPPEAVGDADELGCLAGALAAALQPPAERLAAQREFWQRLKAALAEELQCPDLRLYVFGSLSQQLANRYSDMDLCLLLNAAARHAPPPRPLVLATMDSVRAALLDRLGLRRPDVGVLRHTRVPIVRHTGSHFPCDISFAFQGVCNSAWLRQYVEQKPSVVQPLVLCVTQWVREVGISGNSNGFLSSYSLTLMLLFFLLRCGVLSPLPPDLDLDPEEFPSACPAVAAGQAGQAGEAGADGAHPALLGALLRGFFRFYAAEFPAALLAVSLRDLSGIPKAEKGWWMSPFAVEDPLEPHLNTCRHLSPARWAVVRDRFADAARQPCAVLAGVLGRHQLASPDPSPDVTAVTAPPPAPKQPRATRGLAATPPGMDEEARAQWRRELKAAARRRKKEQRRARPCVAEAFGAAAAAGAQRPDPESPTEALCVSKDGDPEAEVVEEEGEEEEEMGHPHSPALPQAAPGAVQDGSTGDEDEGSEGEDFPSVAALPASPPDIGLADTRHDHGIDASDSRQHT